MKPWYASMMGRVLISFVLIAAWALSSAAKADDVVEFSEDELSRESVLPVFDSPEAVKKRFVPTETRVELQIFGGAGLNDPFINMFPLGASVAYHVSEISSFGIYAAYYASSATSYVSQIGQQVPGAQGTIPFAMNPGPQYSGLAEYEFTPWYGKISLAKQTVMNLNISATIRAGMMGLTNGGGSTLTGGLGLNQRFFFTRNFGLKLDLSTLIYSKGDVIPFNAGQPNTIVANTTQVSLYFTLGAVWLLPSL